jgi:NTE family protein
MVSKEGRYDAPMIRTLLGLALLIVSLPAASAQPVAGVDETEAPRIGLVLSGGGARGIAHVGVLQVLEEMRVPVHAVAGTSMGAVVGGLYAAGLTPDELAAQITGIDWQDALRDKPARQQLVFRRKQDDRGLQIRLRLGLKEGRVTIPLGLLAGQKLSLLLRRLTMPVAGVESFDRLPIPFRAVAGDVLTGDAVVLGAGDLPTALRASMSVPAVFIPVELDGRLLVDGGIANNLPVSVARAMGVDRILAINVSTADFTREDLNSAVSITGQMVSLLIQRNVLEQKSLLTEDDLLVEMALDDINPTQFFRAAELIEAGRQAARAQAEALRRWSLSPAAWEAFLVDRARRRVRAGHEETPTLHSIEVRDDTELQPRIVTSRLRAKVGEPLNLLSLEEDLARIYGLDLYEQVDYRLNPVAAPGAAQSEGEAVDLQIRVRQKPWGPNFLRFGINLEDDLEGETSFTLAARLISTQLNRRGGEWRNDVRLGETQLLGSEFYQPLSVRGFFLAPRLEYSERNNRIALDNRELSRFRVRRLLTAFDLGRELGHCCEVRLGVEYAANDADARSGADFPSIELEELRLVGSFQFDTLDDLSFPTRGGLISAAWEEAVDSRLVFGGDSTLTDFDSSRVSARFLGAFHRGPHIFVGTLELGTSLGDDTLLSPFSLGGFRRLSAFRLNEVSGNHLGFASLIYYHRLGRVQTILNLPFYAGISLEGGNTWLRREEASFSDLLYSATLFAGADTPLGALFVGWGLGEGGRQNYYLLLGRSF